MNTRLRTLHNLLGPPIRSSRILREKTSGHGQAALAAQSQTHVFSSDNCETLHPTGPAADRCGQNCPRDCGTSSTMVGRQPIKFNQTQNIPCNLLVHLKHILNLKCAAACRHFVNSKTRVTLFITNHIHTISSERKACSSCRADSPLEPNVTMRHCVHQK